MKFLCEKEKFCFLKAANAGYFTCFRAQDFYVIALFMNVKNETKNMTADVRRYSK